MRKAIASIAIGLSAAMAAVIGIQAPAQAWRLNADCREYSRGIFDSGFVCVEVWWRHQVDGSGLTVDTVKVTATPSAAFEGSGVKVDGIFLAIVNGHGNVVWSIGNSHCNIGQTGVHSFGMPNGALKISTNSAYVSYSYKARLDNANDKTGTVQRTFG